MVGDGVALVITLCPMLLVDGVWEVVVAVVIEVDELEAWVPWEARETKYLVHMDTK